jgi:hypothetical protein
VILGVTAMPAGIDDQTNLITVPPVPTFLAGFILSLKFDRDDTSIRDKTILLRQNAKKIMGLLYE